MKGFLAGFGVGIGLGFFFAPMKGDEARETIATRSGEIADSARELAAASREQYEQIRGRAGDVVEALKGDAARGDSPPRPRRGRKLHTTGEDFMKGKENAARDIPKASGAGHEYVHEETGSSRDPEERPVDVADKEGLREKMMDKTLADSFPTSDPPSSIPNPEEDDSLVAQSQKLAEAG
ncbi:MAG TPA: YtxH domain-containing protein [Terriglobales bacterium]|nr:YtxH domain-containing protein [Terriglobales bacterium]